MNNYLLKNKKYFPSKKFLIIISIVASVLLISLLAYLVINKKSIISFGSKDNAALAVGNLTVNELIEKDTDGDSVPDWEEDLWGTDKNVRNTFDMPDLAYINNKKKELNAGQTIDETKLTETDKFAREFFSGYTALTASGQVDSNSINGFSNALGQKIANPNLVDTYSESDMKIDVNDNGNDPDQKKLYYASVQKLFQTYQVAGIGDELDIVNAGLATGGTETPESYSKLTAIADAYTNFSKKIMELTVPSELATLHLQIANSANNTGIAVQSMSQVIRDPLVGLQGLSQYQKYSKDLVKEAGDLQTVASQ